jgi:Ni,Fe-hydrogenase III small subunit/ferredoxin
VIEMDKRRDILSDAVETDRDVLSGERSASGFRGDVSLAPVSPDAAADLELYRRLEEVCPTKTILETQGESGPQLALDKGRCITCGMCQRVAPQLIEVREHFAIPARRQEELVVAQVPDSSGVGTRLQLDEMGKQLKEKVLKTLGRSLAVREVDAGSCNGCEVEVSALNNPVYDVERFGVHFVASPRHADVLLVTGVASRNMELALKRTYDATPDPKVVVAVGACACSGGLFGDTYASEGGITKVVPVDVLVPGCPPRPEALLYGLLLAVDRIGKATAAP